MKAIYVDGIVRRFSIASNTSVVHYMSPDGESEGLSIDSFCKSPLLYSCIRAQQQSSTRFYLPMDTRVVLLECAIQPEQDISLTKRVMSFQCNLNDLVIASGGLLVACRPLASSDTCIYLFNDRCEHFPRPHTIDNLLADPVVLPSTEHSGEGRVVSASGTSSGMKLIIFTTSYSLRSYSIPDDCQAPLKLSRQESAVLLVCANATQYMINVTNLLARFFHINSAAHGSLLALSSKGYALFSSPPQLTLQNITSTYAATISIDHSYGNPVYADFTYDGSYAFVATNETVIFIHVTQALTSHDQSEYFYFFPVQICFICPSVQFINSTMAVVSAMDGNEYNIMLQILMLNQWPPYLFLHKILPGFPKHYWFLNDVSTEMVFPTPVTSDTKTIPSSTKNAATITSMDTKPSATSSNSSDDDSDSETVIIIATIVVCLLIFVFAVILLLVAYPMYKKWKQDIQPRNHDNRILNPTATVDPAITVNDTAPVNATAIQEQHPVQSTTPTAYSARRDSPATKPRHR